MDGALRKLTPLVLLALAGIAWFEPYLPLGSLRSSLGEVGILRFILGVVCLYTMFLVIERQRMEVRFTGVLSSFKQFYAQHAARGENAGVAASGGVASESGDELEKSLEAVGILIAALGSADKEVVESAESNLKRLTNKDFGRDAAAWSAWLKDARKVAASGRKGSAS